MKINGEYFTREEAAQVLFSDDKLFKLLKTLYVGNFIIFFLTAAFQVTVAVLLDDDEQRLQSLILGFLGATAVFLLTAVLEYFSRKYRHPFLVFYAQMCATLGCVFTIISFIFYIRVANYFGPCETAECTAVFSCTIVLCVAALVGVVFTYFNCIKLTPLLCCNPKFKELAVRVRGRPWPPAPVRGPAPPPQPTNSGQLHTYPPLPPATVYTVQQHSDGTNEDWRRMGADQVAVTIESKLPAEKEDVLQQ